jgi:uncharacterized protein (DUF4415 family)
MNGLNMNTMMTLDQLQAARARGESKSDFATIRERQRLGIEPQTDEDSPDATHLIHAAIAKRRGRPAGTAATEQIAIRVNKEALTRWRATGKGWQTRAAKLLENAVA